MKLLIVDDHPVVIAGCRRLFSEEEDVEVFDAKNISETRAAIENVVPDVILLDINLPDGSGLELTRELTAKHSSISIIVFSTSDAPVLVAYAIQCGAKGYISKNSEPLDIVAGVRAAAKGKPWMAADLTQRVAFLKTSLGAEILNGHDRSILRLLAKGQGLQEIGAALSVSYRTIIEDVIELREKFGARSLTELVRIAAELKLSE